MLQRLEKLGASNIPTVITRQVIHRESLENTGKLGAGLAIPHARTDSVARLHFHTRAFPPRVSITSPSTIAPVRYVSAQHFSHGHEHQVSLPGRMMARIFRTRETKGGSTRRQRPQRSTRNSRRTPNSTSRDLAEEEPGSESKLLTSQAFPLHDLDLLIRLDSLYHLYDEDKSIDSTGKKIEACASVIDNRSLTYYERMRKKCQNPFAIVDKAVAAAAISRSRRFISSR